MLASWMKSELPVDQQGETRPELPRDVSFKVRLGKSARRLRSQSAIRRGRRKPLSSERRRRAAEEPRKRTFRGGRPRGRGPSPAIPQGRLRKWQQRRSDQAIGGARVIPEATGPASKVAGSGTLRSRSGIPLASRSGIPQRSLAKMQLPVGRFGVRVTSPPMASVSRAAGSTSLRPTPRGRSAR